MKFERISHAHHYWTYHSETLLLLRRFQGKKVLTLDQVIAILVDMKNGSDWETALRPVPTRLIQSGFRPGQTAAAAAAGDDVTARPLTGGSLNFNMKRFRWLDRATQQKSQPSLEERARSPRSSSEDRARNSRPSFDNRGRLSRPFFEDDARAATDPNLINTRLRNSRS